MSHVAQIKLGDNRQGTYCKDWTIANGWAAAADVNGAQANGVLTFSYGAPQKDPFDADESANTTLLALDGYNKKVGIGTYTPDTTLEVVGSFAANGPLSTFVTMSSGDTSPDVSTGNILKVMVMVLP